MLCLSTKLKSDAHNKRPTCSKEGLQLVACGWGSRGDEGLKTDFTCTYGIRNRYTWWKWEHGVHTIVWEQRSIQGHELASETTMDMYKWCPKAWNKTNVMICVPNRSQVQENGEIQPASDSLTSIITALTQISRCFSFWCIPNHRTAWKCTGKLITTSESDPWFLMWRRRGSSLLYVVELLAEQATPEALSTVRVLLPDSQ